MKGRTPLIPARVGVLEAFVAAGIFGPAEVHLAEAIARHGGLVPGDELDDRAVLAVATAAAALRHRNVCIDLGQVAERLADPDSPAPADLPWPPLEVWRGALSMSTLVATPSSAQRVPRRPLVVDGDRLYLQRFWHAETLVRDGLVARSAATLAAAQSDIDAVVDDVFGAQSDEPDLQRVAVAVALAKPLSIIVGGPGTGKTWTIAKFLSAVERLSEKSEDHLLVALAAPTGKAAARMTEAVEAEVGPDRFPAATTLHRLLGARMNGTVAHDRKRPIPHDVVVVDETSMVDLSLMAKLLEAMRPTARLVLVGDPYQLASVGTGTVLRDIVGPLASGSTLDVTGPLAGHITMLERVHRFGERSAIAELSDAIRTGDADRAMKVLDESNEVHLISPDDAAALVTLRTRINELAVEVVQHARQGDASAAMSAALRLKVLAATHRGPFGLDDWNDRIERAVADQVYELNTAHEWYVGRPVLVTMNDRLNRVSNGDVGLVIPGHGDGVMVALNAAAGVREIHPTRLREVATWWAMTIHKSQGSEFDHVVVSLPRDRSPILTRELLYTAVTRARSQVTIVASEARVREAIENPVARASGLRERLWMT